MADLLKLSSRFIDEGIYEGPGSVNRINGQLSLMARGFYGDAARTSREKSGKNSED